MALFIIGAGLIDLGLFAGFIKMSTNLYVTAPLGVLITFVLPYTLLVYLGNRYRNEIVAVGGAALASTTGTIALLFIFMATGLLTPLAHL